MKQMTKSACAAVGLTASILVGGCASNAASRGNEDRSTASAATAQTDTNAPTADASSGSSKSKAASASASAAPAASTPSANTPSANTPAASAPSASAASPGMGSSAQASEKRGEFQGRIERLDRADNAVIAGSESVGLAFEEFKIDDKTQVTTPSGKGTVAELNEGDEVRASFSGSGEDLHVDKLQVVTPKPADDAKSR